MYSFCMPIISAWQVAQNQLGTKAMTTNCKCTSTTVTPITCIIVSFLQVHEGDTELMVEVWNANTIQDEVIGNVRLILKDEKTFKPLG